MALHENISETTQPLAVIHANVVLKLMTTCAGMQQHLVDSGAAYGDLEMVTKLLEDPDLAFFSIKRVVERQVYKAKKIADFIPADE